MKKFLSLVLALIMTMSLVTISAGADFADDASIDNKEAVDVAAALGIVGGSAGNFYPDGTLTRGAAAKMISILYLGADGAAQLPKTAAPFKDVAAGSTFAPYIAWASEKGIIGGYSDGTYRPGANLSGYAWLKMLLVALGYDATIENYTGGNMGANVAEDAMDRGLLDGVKGFVGSNPLTRQDACQMILNTLEAWRVRYDNKGTNITTSDGTVINVGASAAEVVGITWPDDTFYDRYQPDLGRNRLEDAFSRPATRWTVDNKEVGVYPDAPAKVYVGQVEGKTLYTDLNLDTNVTTTTVATNSAIEALAGTDITKGSAVKYGNAGWTMEAYTYEDANGVIIGVELVLVETNIAKITKVADNADGEREITVGGMQFKTEEFAKNDWVLYTVADGVVKSVEAAEKLTGKLTKIVGGTKYTIDGTVYTMQNGKMAGAGVGAGDNVDFYLSGNGYIVKIDEAAASAVSVDNLAYVETAGTERGTWAVLRFADGSKKTVDTKADYSNATGAAGSKLENYVVKFEIADDGTYELKYTGAETSKLTGGAGVKYENSKPNFNGIAVDSKTNFLVAQDDAGKVSHKAYVGYANVPSFDSTATGSNGTDSKYAYVVDDGAVIFMYVEMKKADLTADTSKVMTIIAYKQTADTVSEKDKDLYREANAVVDGAATTLKVLSTATGDILDSYIFESYVTDDGIVTSATDATAVDESNTKVEVKNGTVQFDAAAAETFAWADDVAVYVINDKFEITEISIDDIEKDNDNTGEGTNPYARIDYVVDANTDKLTTIVLIEA